MLIYGDFATDKLRINNALGVGRLPTTNNFEVNGNFCSKSLPGSWAANSDSRLKRNIQQLNPEESLDKILQLKGVSYLWYDNRTGYERPSESQIGFIAQDVQAVFPQNVFPDSDGWLQTAYSEYDPIFVEAFRALDTRTETQNQNVVQLQQEMIFCGKK